MSRQVREEGASLGLVQAIESAGGQVVADGCVVVAPMRDLPYRTLATNSAKMATYAWPHAGLRVRFGSLAACCEAGLDGPLGTAYHGGRRTWLRAMHRSCAGASSWKARPRVSLWSAIAPSAFWAASTPTPARMIEKGHPLEGQSVAGRVLVFPTGKGSTVGSYMIYRLAKAGLAPCAIINASSEPIVAVGALIAGIPMVDRVDIGHLRTGMCVLVRGGDSPWVNSSFSN